MVCINCGVELEDDMRRCPLCDTPVDAVPDGGKKEPLRTEPRGEPAAPPKETHLLQRILWQITFIILLSGILSTLIIDLAVHKRITWSVYPVTVCLVIFSYASLFAFWHARKIWQVTGGLLLSTVLLMALHWLFPQAVWLLQLGLPMLYAVNVIAVLLAGSVRRAAHRGLNVIAYAFVAMAVLCACIEGILSFYHHGGIMLRWSVIVAACMLPVIAALLFMHHRIKKNPDMERIFHT